MLLWPSSSLSENLAIIIGVSNYENTQGLPNASKDADALYRRFQALGYRSYLLKNPSKSKLLKTFLGLQTALKDATQVVVYFAGHGVHYAGKSYLLPVDVMTEKNKWHHKSIELGFLLRILTQTPKQVIVFIDACQESPVEPIDLPITQTVSQPAGILLSYASQFGASAFDGAQENGPFASAILQHFQSPGQNIMTQLRKVRRHVVVDTNGLQIPWVQSSLLNAAMLGQPSETDRLTISQ